MGDKIERQKINERETNFSYEEKHDIAQKSGERCCHCGKKVYFGYGATIEHFVPLSKGGTNRDINLVMLCKDCNDAKSDFIYRPNDYLQYLNPEHLEKMNGYFESYINSFDFVNRKNLLSCDVYNVKVNPITNYYLSRKATAKKPRKKVGIFHSVKRVITKEDLDRITDYYIKYLKKYDCLDSIEYAKLNILFWYNFGCIYYVEKDNDIKTFVTVMVTKSNGTFTCRHEEVDCFLNMNIFTYYSNDYSFTLSWNLIRQIPSWIGAEQNINKIPVKVNILKADTVSYGLVDKDSIFYVGNRFIEAFMILCEDITDPNEQEDDKNLKIFFDKFAVINKENMEQWFKDHDSEAMEWMISEILLPDLNDEDSEEEST